jgi:signal transduction histidine kinase
MPNRWKRFKQTISKLTSKAVPKLRLSHQLLGFFVVVVLFPLLLLSLSIYSINQRAVKKQIAHFTTHTAEATYEELRLEMFWQQEQAKLADEYWSSLIELPTHKQREARIRQFFDQYNDFDAVAFYDASGHRKMLFRSRNAHYQQSEIPESLQSLPQDVTFKLNYHKTDPKASDLTYSLQVLVPSKAFKNGEIPGSIIFLKRFPYLGHLIKEKFSTFQNGFVIADRDGTIIAGPSGVVSQKLPPKDLAFYRSLPGGVIRELSTEKTARKTKHQQRNDDRDDPKLDRVFIKVPRLGWGIIIESPYRIQRTFITTARTQSVALVFLCILVIIVLGFLYSRGINRNFRQLIKGIKALAEGHYSRKIRLITKSWTPYEIVYLTAEFNRMATKISTAWASIQKLNQELVYKNQQDLFIAKITQRLHSTLELETVCTTAVETLNEHPEISGAILYLLSSDNKFELTAFAVHHLFYSPGAQKLKNFEEQVFRKALSIQHAITTSNVALPFLNEKSQATIQPIFYQAHPLGVLVLIKPEQESSTTTPLFDDDMLLNLISNQIGVAIHQARQWHELQKANTQLAKIDELKSNLIDTVSHELRTPLTNIKGYTSRLIRYEDSLDSQTKIKSLKIIKQQTDRLTRLVEDLLVIPDLEREEGIRVFPDRVDLMELIQRCVAFMHEKANREINILAPTHWPDVLVDPDRMEQVLLNLLDNAIKYSSEDSAIEVTIKQISSTMAQIQVFNDCEPISPVALSTLFAKFQRLDERLTRTTRGTGLGLFITKGLIEAMGGKIRLDGREGFRVVLEVPLFTPQPLPDEQYNEFVSVE